MKKTKNYNIIQFYFEQIIKTKKHIYITIVKNLKIGWWDMSYTLVKNGTLINGTGGTPIKNAAVLIEDNIISAIGPEESIKIPDANVYTCGCKGMVLYSPVLLMPMYIL